MCNPATGYSHLCSLIPGTGMSMSFTKTEKGEGCLERRGPSRARDRRELNATTGSGWEKISEFAVCLAVL